MIFPGIVVVDLKTKLKRLVGFGDGSSFFTMTTGLLLVRASALCTLWNNFFAIVLLQISRGPYNYCLSASGVVDNVWNEFRRSQTFQLWPYSVNYMIIHGV